MRMWMISPKLMCRTHLMGEHFELHMFYGSIKQNKNLTGFYEKGLLNPHLIEQRHNEVAEEMLKRGYKHISELKIDENKIKDLPIVIIDAKENAIELKNRCVDCRDRMERKESRR